MKHQAQYQSATSARGIYGIWRDTTKAQRLDISNLDSGDFTPLVGDFPFWLVSAAAVAGFIFGITLPILFSALF